MAYAVGIQFGFNEYLNKELDISKKIVEDDDISLNILKLKTNIKIIHFPFLNQQNFNKLDVLDFLLKIKGNGLNVKIMLDKVKLLTFS